MHDLTGFQRDSLYVLAGLDSPKGLSVKEALDEYYTKEVSHPRLYTNLDTLVDMGLVEKSERDGRTNEYALTERGRREIESRRQWEEEHTTGQEAEDAPSDAVQDDAKSITA